MDIETSADIKKLVDRFYEKVNRDELLGPVFNEVAGVDWPSHLATLYTFWETLLFSAGTYQGAPFPKHAVLPVEKAHFDRWLELFLATVNENFSGPKAEEAKEPCAQHCRHVCAPHGRVTRSHRSLAAVAGALLS